MKILLINGSSPRNTARVSVEALAVRLRHK